MEPTGINKVLVEKYGYQWVNGQAWRPGTAPEPEIAAPIEPPANPEIPATSEPEPVISQEPEIGVEPASNQPEAEAAPLPTLEPTPAPKPSYPEPTGINKVLVEKYGYEWVNGQAWKPGTAPEPEIAAPIESSANPEGPATSEPDDLPIIDDGNWEIKYNELLVQYDNLEAENAELKIDITPFSQSDIDSAIASAVTPLNVQISNLEDDLEAAKVSQVFAEQQAADEIASRVAAEAELAAFKLEDTTPFSQSDIDSSVAVASMDALKAQAQAEADAAEALVAQAAAEADAAAAIVAMVKAQAELDAALEALQIAEDELASLKQTNQFADQYDFEELFYDDFYNKKWTEDGETKTIMWSVADYYLEFSDQLYSTTARASDYLEEIRQAISLWDEQIESISFKETNLGNRADLTFGITSIDGPGGIYGQWYSYWYGDVITDSAIRIDTDMVSSPLFEALLLHEIGNILGLGDIRKTNSIKSVQEEPIETFTSDQLYPDDIAMIKQLYGETPYTYIDDTPFSQTDIDAAVAAANALNAAKEDETPFSQADVDAAVAAAKAESEVELAVALAAQAAAEAQLANLMDTQAEVADGSQDTEDQSSFGSWEYLITTREMEANNTPMTSNFLKQTEFTGQSYSSSDKDYYVANLPNWDVIELSFSSNHWDDHKVSIIDSLGITLASKTISTNGTLVAKPYHDGFVYILVEESDYDRNDYTITLTQGSGNYEMEPNNFVADADRIYNNVPIKGQSISSSDKDYFVFTATSEIATVSLSSSHWDDHQISILNSSGQTMAQKSVSTSGSLVSSTIIGEDYHVLIDGSDYDRETYILTVSTDVV